MLIPILHLPFFFVLGALLGSFLNVCTMRWPRNESVVSPRSRCPRCGHQLAWFENVPMVSWLALRGRCRCCDERISIQYPLVELAVGLGWMAACWSFGPTFTAVRVAIFGTVLAGIAITDARFYLIPDEFTVWPFFWTLASAAAAALLGHDSPFAGPWLALLGACAGAGFISIVGWLGEYFLKREAMGFGDVTLMALVGAALGPGRAIATVFVGAFLAVAVFLLAAPVLLARRGQARTQHELALGGGEAPIGAPEVPFGVFLAPAALLTLLWGDAVLARWLG
ncbi:MAG TPA: prepilin peptidase [Gemmatimonadaceae bacterium]|nr:prepilin peptidase [Gemmatimonadaceae bacterium]